ncbi:MSC_0620 family F1-like ATPase-associated subunit [Metamycoplasma orale]|uniref:Transmembrane protein n=1 Tax=Metamycoplasma orale TaxID=2121 RepID=A0A448ZVL1_METOS|nr:hypothetical protein [Metamycoplasma orale]VEU55298.1 Uncharacterised protein [Metamycoplasma orale]
MNKHKKFRLILGMPSLCILPSLSLVMLSAEKKNDPNFDNFDKFASDEIKTLIPKVIDNAITYVKSKYDQILANKELDFKVRIQNLLYLKNLLKYFEDNKNNIKDHPTNYGFHLVLPYVISKNKKYNLVNVEFNGQTYQNIKAGYTDPSDYVNAIKPNGKITISQKDQINEFSKEIFEKTIKKYSSELIKELKSIIYDSKDVPVIDKDVELKEDSDGRYVTTLPKDFDNWNTYIASKIKTRFVEFDLKQNQEAEEKQNENTQPTQPPSLPPIVPGDKNEIPGIQDLDNKIQTLPLLVPYISHKYAQQGLLNIKNQFDSLQTNEKNKIFYFNNPINTRYQYKVISFEYENAKVLKNIKIEISDKNNAILHKQYILDKITFNLDTNWNKLKENQINSVQKTFLKLYKALGVDEKINYDSIRNQFLQNALFNNVNAATELVSLKNSESFEDLENKRINDNYLLLDNNNNLLNKLSKYTIYSFLSSLNSVKINSNSFWLQIPQAFEAIQYQFKEVIKHNQKFILNNLSQINGKNNQLIKLFDINTKNIDKLFALVRQRTFNLENWYSEYIDLISKIKQTFSLFSVLALNNDIKNDNKFKTEFIKSYDLVNKYIEENTKNKNNIKVTSGISLLVISTIMLIASIILFILNGKNRKTNNKSKHLLIAALIVMVLAISLLTTGALLITLGIKGV